MKYLSIIITGRNDNYGGDFTQRLQNFITWNTALLEKHQVHTEIIIVNWNPIDENLSIQKSIDWGENTKYVSYRIINVPKEIHNYYNDNNIRKNVPLYEFIAKNTGIKRAKGEYVLCTNADILIAESIIKFIAAKKLNKKTFYRANRADFKITSNILEENLLYDSTEVVSYKGFFREIQSFRNKKWGYYFYHYFNSIVIRKELLKYQFSWVFRFFSFIIYDNAEYYVHCNNCGDFMLMHQENWIDLKGYPEYTYISTHTDAIFTIFAYTALKEYIFHSPVFHQIHERRYTWESIKKEAIFKDVYQNFQQISQDLLNKRKPLKKFLNKDNWGLEAFDLVEITI